MRRGAQVVFAFDRSNSMDDTIDGQERDPGDPRPSRWDILEGTLDPVLRGADPLLEFGAEFYPGVGAEGATTPEEACSIDPGIDIRPASGNARQILRVFSDTEPAGGTPTSLALGEVEAYYERTPDPFVPRFVVLATDGGPNCNPDTGVPTATCICTGRRSPIPDMDDCNPASVFGAYNCLDRDRTLETIDRLFLGLEIPVYVIGIDDPSRPDLADVLDEMAMRGGRPRDAAPGERFFYSVASEADLRDALMTITDSISRCVFEVSPAPTLDATVEVTIDGARIPRDGTRTEGWDFTNPDRSEITLFGGACARVTETGGEVVATILCEE